MTIVDARPAGAGPQIRGTELRGDATGAITVLVVGGTGESDAQDRRVTVTGLLAGVTAALDDRFAPRWVGYPASYGPATHSTGMSYEDSVAEGVRRLSAAADQTAGRIVMIGYSQGAVVIRRYLHEAAAQRSLASLVAVGFVADPHQPPGVLAGCDGWGVAGPGPALPQGIPAWWVGIADDVICNAGDDSLIRDIADLTGSMTFAAPRAWMRQMGSVLRTNSMQNAGRTAFRPAQWRRDTARLWSAWREARSYLPAVIGWRRWAVPNRPGGRHTSYQSEPYAQAPLTDPTTTGCQALAYWLQVQATFTPQVCDAVANETRE